MHGLDMAPVQQPKYAFDITVIRFGTLEMSYNLSNDYLQNDSQCFIGDHGLNLFG
jgi:hypothetical protein